MTFCSPGWSDINLESGFYSFFLHYLEEKESLTFQITPYNIAALLQQREVSSLEIHQASFNKVIFPHIFFFIVLEDRFTLSNVQKWSLEDNLFLQ